MLFSNYLIMGLGAIGGTTTNEAVKHNVITAIVALIALVFLAKQRKQ